MAEIREETSARPESLAASFLKDLKRGARSLFFSRVVMGAAEAADGVSFTSARGGRRGPHFEFPDSSGGPPAGELARAATVRLCVPRRLAMVKETVLPSAVPEELEGMLGYEMENLFPVPPDELTWDFQPVEVTGEGYTRVRIVAVETEVLEERLESAGLSQEYRAAVEPSTISLSNFALAARGGWPEEPEALVAAGAEGIDLAVVGPGGLIFDRGTGPVGPEGRPEEVAAEVATSIAMYRESDAGAPPTGVALVADDASGALSEALREATGLPVRTLEGGSLGDGVAERSLAGILSAGAALGPYLQPGVHIELMAPEVRRRGGQLRRLRAAVLTLGLGALFLGLLWAGLFLRANRLEAFVSRLESRVEEMAPEARRVDAQRQRLAAIKSHISGRSRILDLVLELYRVTPPDISLTRVELDDENILTISGHAQRIFRASEYGQILDESGMFGEPAQDWLDARQRSEGQETFITFTILRDLSEST